MKQIPLTQGCMALVDDSDFEELSKHKWCAMKRGKTWYAFRGEKTFLGIQRTIMMHRQIMKTPGGMETDHINGDGLDNRHANLRECSKSQNQMNAGARADNTSGYRGVSWSRSLGKWRVTIMVESNKKHIGYFEDKEEAARAYDKTAKKFFGDFAKTNF